MPEADPPPAACLNCGQPFGDPRPRHCPACGQETNVKPPTLREFAQQFGGSYIAVEGALWRTLKLLLFKPGQITREYLEGRRRRYVLPLRLYLTVSVVVLLALRLAAHVNVKFEDHGTLSDAPPRELTIHLGFGEAGLKDGRFFCRGLPRWTCERLGKRIDVDAQGMRQQVRDWSERFVANLGSAMFVLVPGFAAWLRLVYLRRGLRYTEHLVFALHVHAFWFVVIAVMMAELPLVSDLAPLVVPVYTLLAMKRVYGGRWWPLLARALVVCLLYGLTLLAALGMLALWSLLF